MCSILVPPCCSSVQHQRKTEGLLLCVHSSSKTTWHNLKMHSQPLRRGSTRTWTSYKHAQEQLATSHSSYFFFWLLCQWQIAKVATQAKEQYLRSLQDNEPQIHISSGSSGLSSSLILKNEDQVRSNQPGILDFSQTWTEFYKTGCISYKCPSCPFAATQDQLKKKNNQKLLLGQHCIQQQPRPLPVENVPIYRQYHLKTENVTRWSYASVHRSFPCKGRCLT